MACPIVPFHPSLSPEEIANILEKTKPHILFCDDSSFDVIKEIVNKSKWNGKVYTFSMVGYDGAEPVSNLLRETGDEANFVYVTQKK